MKRVLLNILAAVAAIPMAFVALAVGGAALVSRWVLRLLGERDEG